MNVHNLFNQVEGVGFVGPTSTVKKAIRQESAFVAPKKQYTPLSPVPIPHGGATTQPVRVVPDSVTYYDPNRTFTYTREQIEQMRERQIMPTDLGPLEHLEITDPQRWEDGDGIDSELEVESIQQDATEKAINDAANGGTDFESSESVPDKKDDIVPLAALGALAYFIFM